VTSGDAVPRTRHDAFVRHVFGRPKAAAIEFRHVLPPELVAELDLDTLAASSSAYRRPSRTPLDSDLVFTVRLRGPEGAEPCSIDMMLDHQSNPDELYPWRSHVYVGELWGRHVAAQARRPRQLRFVVPVLMVQYPARDTPTRLSDILRLPDHVRGIFGSPFETKLYVDDLSGSVLDDPVADPGHLALVEIARTLLYAYKNPDAIHDPRVPTLGPLFDIVLDCFGPGEIEEIMSYAVNVLGEGSPIFAMLTRTLSKGVAEMFVTIADKWRAEGHAAGHAAGHAEGRTIATAQALLRVLDHRTGPVPSFVRERVLATADEQLLERWFDRALSALSVEQVFQPLDA
jgi:hypothetical protein